MNATEKVAIEATTKTEIETAEEKIKSFYDAVLIARRIIPPICGIGHKIEEAHKEGVETIFDDVFKELLRECSKFVESFREDKDFLDEETIKVFSAFIVYADAYLILNK